MKPFSTLIASLVAFFFLLGFTMQTIAPQLKRYIIIKLEEETREKLPISILANDIKVSLIPMSVSIEGVKTKIDPSQIKVLKRLRLGGLKFELDIFSLLAGQVALGNLKLNKLEADLKISQGSSKSGANAVGEASSATQEEFDLFGLLEKIPIQKIDLRQAKIKIENPGTKPSDSQNLEVKNIDASIFNDFNALLVDLNTPSIRVKTKTKGKEKTIGPISLAVEAHLDSQSLNISTLESSINQLKVNLQGNLTHQNLTFEKPQGTLAAQLNVDLLRVAELIQQLTDENIKLAGTVESNINTRFDGKKVFSLNSVTNAKGIDIEDTKLGEIDLATSYEGQKFVVEKLDWNGIGASADFEKTFLDIETGKFQGDVKITKMDLPVFLDAIDVDGVPVNLDIMGLIRCKGKLLPTLRADCGGKLDLEDMVVKAKRTDKMKIVAIDKGVVSGGFIATLDSVKYDADLKLTHPKGDSDLKSDGEIIYDQGFKINYTTENLNLFHIGKLVDMDLEGYAAITGSTEGDAEDATIAMQLRTRDFYLSDYLLGNVNSRMDFGARTLNFSQFSANIGRSRYRGQIVVDLDKNTIQSDLSIPFFETSNVITAVERHIPIPFGITGAGQGTLSFAGPLQFNKLSYQLKTNISKGTFAGDSFDRMVIYLTSKEGYVNIDVGEVTKNESLIEIKGTMTPEFMIDVQVQSDKMLVEESEWVSNVTSSVTGEVNFFSEFKGPIHAPTIIFKGAMKKVAFSDEPVPDSTVGFRFGDETLSGAANILGNRVKAQFTFPLAENAPFRFVAESNNWDFGALIAALGGERFRGEYSTNLTSKVNLVASLGGVWNSTGKIEIGSFKMQRGTQSLENEKPIDIGFSRGKISVNNFELVGENNLIRIEGKDFTKNNLNIGINGRTDLRLFHLFVPFLEEVGGPASFAFKLGGSAYKPQILGSAFVERAYTKIFGLPHPFEAIKSDVTFSQSKILINSLAADFAKGKLQASGQVDLVGLNKFPVNVTGTASNIEIEIPDGVKTRGSADLRFHGDWFPYTLEGKYRVTGGEITMEFEQTGAEESVKKSTMLPEILAERDFEPIVFDIETNVPEKLKINNSYIDGHITGNIKTKNTPLEPILLGTIDVAPDSILKFRENKFDVKTAKIQFKNEDQIDPELFISAETEKESDGNNYIIDLLLQGTATKPLMKLSSQPPLDETSIVSLLAFGITSDNKTNSDAQPTINESFTNLLPIAQELEDQLGLKINFSTNFEENSADEVQKVTFSKDFGERLSGSFTRASGKKTTDEAELRYRLSDRLSALGTGTNTTSTEGADENSDKSILGLDLEYKVEFK